MPRTEPDTRPTGAADGSAAPLLRVENLHRHFVTGPPRNRKVLRAVDGVTFEVRAGECLAVVGESGSGKSTLARALMRLVEPTGGKVYYKGRDLLALSDREMRQERRNIQMVFQDPYASLHPRRTVGDVVREAWRVHKDVVPRARQADQVAALLRQVGLPEAYASLYPSRLSGGERQRVAIARALALRPELLVLDEPVSALDVSIQAQVVHVLMKLHAELGLAYIFISHDLNLVRLVADRVAVMYMGRLVESGTTEELYEHPAHPYTRALLSASPGRDTALDPDDDVLPGAVAGEAPGPLGTAVGCPYRTRCPRARDVCATERPELGAGAHPTACHFPAGKE
ncbi:ABC transporter ATP-binding protein [Streptomyces sp. IBSBF 2953]|uniref:ABC transporter ATP-binding protein n=1 Tax=Streptomyces TaxID=1883 RepID=UPI00211A3E4E|nr:ABC transporter ATP-binding protein [Streptomyces scabiei]MCQ9183679.1 ABC transporter ATP-binding protein [Streptomyces hayashii]MDX3113575.1 ABC transporter ATP-binding protein [Streptomyces scabiei]